MKRIAMLALAGLTALALTACEKSVDGIPAAVVKATSNPAHAIESAAAKMKEGDLLAVIQMSVPPAQVARMKASWKTKFNDEPISDEDRAEFAATMAKLTASDAEAALFAELEPELAKFDAEMAPQMGSMILIAQGFAMQAVNNHQSMNDTQKKQVGDVVLALVTWLQEVKFSDRELARKAIAETVTTARALGLKTLDEVHALDFETGLAKAGKAMQSLKRTLAIYGLNLDESLGSVKAKVISQEGDSAKVQVDYQIFGQPLSFETEMVQKDGRWYGKDTLAQIESELSKPAEPAMTDGADAPAEPTSN